MTLDEAWAKAEAALPDRCSLTFFPPYDLLDGGRSEWTVRAEKQIAWGGRGKSRYWRLFADGPTAAAALLALAAAASK